MTVATLLPNGKQQFFDANGNPLSNGTVEFYIPNTTTPKNTWQDAEETILNTNPVALDAGGFAIIYGAGQYRQIVKDSNGVTIWDQLTASTNSSQIFVGGQSAGTANAQTLAIPGYSLEPGNLILFTFGLTNTSAMTMNIQGTGNIPVTKLSGGVQVPLVAGDVVAGQFGALFYDGTSYQLISKIGASLPTNPLTNIASASTTDLGSTGSTNDQITGTTTINSFGSSANVNNPLYFIKFAASLTLTYNATSMILPGAANITTAAGDTAFALYLGSGNWQVVQYTVAANGFQSIAGVLPGVLKLAMTNAGGTLISTTADYAVLINTTTHSAAAFSNININCDLSVSGLGGLDTGAVAASSWYYLFYISNGTLINTLASLSPTAPTLPAGYTLSCRIGAVLTDGGANLVVSNTKGRWSQYNSPASMGNGAITLSPAFIPPTATRMQMICTNPNAVITSFNNGISVLQSGFNGITGETGNFTNVQTIEFLVVTATITVSGGTAAANAWEDSVNAC